MPDDAPVVTAEHIRASLTQWRNRRNEPLTFWVLPSMYSDPSDAEWLDPLLAELRLQGVRVIDPRQQAR